MHANYHLPSLMEEQKVLLPSRPVALFKGAPVVQAGQAAPEWYRRCHQAATDCRSQAQDQCHRMWSAEYLLIDQ